MKSQQLKNTANQPNNEGRTSYKLRRAKVRSRNTALLPSIGPNESFTGAGGSGVQCLLRGGARGPRRAEVPGARGEVADAHALVRGQT